MNNQILRGCSVLLLVLFFAPGVVSVAQDREYIYDHFNISNGLISDMVHKIVMDREGHAWIITYNGLQKYNGYEFETYTSNPESEGTLSSNFVEDIFEDHTGALIVVLDDGIDIYDKYSDSFRNLMSDVPFGEIRRDEISRRTSAVQDPNGSIWVNCNNQLVRIDSNKNDFIVYQDEYRGRFVLNADGTLLLIITDNTIKKYSLDKNLLTITSIEDIPGPRPVHRLNTIYYDSKGICWIGTSDGLYAFDERNTRFLEPGSVLPVTNPGQILFRDITSIYEDYLSDLWIASGKSLHKIDRMTGTTQKLQHELDNPNSILDEQITGIHGDRSGIIWVTYINEGFTRINIRTSNFLSYRHRPGYLNSLGGKSVRSVFEDEKGYIWVGLYNDGLDRIHPVTGNTSHLKHTPGDRTSVCSNYISSLLMDDHGRLWVGSHDNGLGYTDHPYSRNPDFRTPPFLNTHEEIYHMQEDTLGRIWIGTRAGLGMYTYGSDSLCWVLTGHNVQSFIIDHPNIWIASWNAGLCKLVFSGEQFRSESPVFDSVKSVYHAPSDPEVTDQRERNDKSGGLHNCISIYLDQENTIWLGTYDRGLVRATEAEGEIRYTVYDAGDGAPGNAVYGIVGDRDGNIWISTQHGLGKFDPVSERFENFYREDGLLSNYFMWKSYFKSPDGYLYFGTVDGLNVFYPDEIITDTLSASVFISELRIQSREINLGDTVNGDVILRRHITYQDTLILNHWNRNFSFGFFATGHPNPKKLTYSHILEEFDKEWNENAPGNRNATYTNLSPGTYQFRVRATESNTDWYGRYSTKVVVVMPPWWKTRLAYACYILLLSGLIFLITHSLIRFLGLKQELIYNEKLHQSKMMFFTNISHEFKAPLSLIKAPLNEILNEKELSPHNRKNLSVAKQNADNLLNLVDELMEFRRTDTGVSKLRAEKIELTGFVSEIVDQFECIAEQKGVHFYFNIPDDPVTLWADREKFRKIINNLLDNALRYTSKEGLVTLSIIRSPSRFSFKPDYHTLQLNEAKKEMKYAGILVSDTGVGISRESLPRIFDRFYQIEAERASHHIGSGIGLALVKNLVLMHQGEIQVASERGMGTEILVLLPLGDSHLKDEQKTIAMNESPNGGSSENESIPVNAGPATVQEEVPGLPGILLVEDHEELRQYLVENLSDEYRFYEASNGAEGLEILKDQRPDLIITDWIMPVMDGAAFIETIRTDERTSSIPVILLTAKDEVKDWQDGLEMGADQVIPKPFNLQLLRTQLRRIIANNRSRMRKYSLETRENLADFHGDSDARFMKQVEHIINEHIGDTGLNAAMIARELGVSRTSLYDRIRVLTGQTIGECIQKTRLKQAVKLMLYENIPVSEVYVMVGFSSSSYLILLFKKYYQTTPKEYIRNYLRTASN